MAFAGGISRHTERLRILQTDDVRPATKHASDAIVAGWVLGGRGDLTRDLEDTAHVKRSTRRRAFKWSFNFVVVRRAYHIRHHARCAHHGIVRLDTVFGHTNERASVVRVPKEAWLTTQSRGAEFELIGEFCVMRDVLEAWVLCIVSLVSASTWHVGGPFVYFSSRTRSRECVASVASVAAHPSHRS